MSAPIFKSDTLFFQRLMSSAGLYSGALSGKWDAKTDAASTAFDAQFAAIAKQYGTFDTRSEGVIATIMPKAQIAARKFLAIAAKAPFTVRLLSGTRTYAEQNALFAKRPVVTRARGGQSNHNFGIAWDCGIFVGGVYYEGKNRKKEQAYDDLAALVKPKSPELEWGGDWKSIVDKPHYQLVTGKTVSQCRALLEAGKSYV